MWGGPRMEDGGIWFLGIIKTDSIFIVFKPIYTINFSDTTDWILRDFEVKYAILCCCWWGLSFFLSLYHSLSLSYFICSDIWSKSCTFQNVKLAKVALRPGAGNMVNGILRKLVLLQVRQHQYHNILFTITLLSLIYIYQISFNLRSLILFLCQN